MEWKMLPASKPARKAILNNPTALARFSERVRTPFELALMGGTSSNEAYLQQRGYLIKDLHTPVAILGHNDFDPTKASIEEVSLIRKHLLFYTISGSIYFITPDLRNQQLAVILEPLDPVTGVTTRDPRVLGIYDRETRQVNLVPERNLNLVVYEKIKQYSDDPHFKTRENLYFNNPESEPRSSQKEI